MIEQAARVLSVDERGVRLQTEQQSGCQSCDAKGGCGTSLIAQLFPNRPEQVLTLPQAQCPANLHAGARVTLSIDEKHFGLMSLWLYLVPLLGLLLGSVLGKWLFQLELAAVMGGLAGLVTGLMWSRQQSRQREKELRAAINVLDLQEQSVDVHFDPAGLNR